MFNFFRQQEQKVQEAETCSICLEDVNKRGFVTLDCGHEFHLKCWMQLKISVGANRDKCPNCRADQDVPSVQREDMNVQNPIEYLIDIGRRLGINVQGPAPVAPVAPVVSFETRILNLIGEGKTVQQVKRELNLGNGYSEGYIRNVMNRMINQGTLRKFRQGRAYTYVRV